MTGSNGWQRSHSNWRSPWTRCWHDRRNLSWSTIRRYAGGDRFGHGKSLRGQEGSQQVCNALGGDVEREREPTSCGRILHSSVLGRLWLLVRPVVASFPHLQQNFARKPRALQSFQSPPGIRQHVGRCILHGVVHLNNLQLSFVCAMKSIWPRFRVK